MAAYAYASLDLNGKLIRGTREDVSLDELKQWLSSNHLLLVSWQELTPSVWPAPGAAAADEGARPSDSVTESLRADEPNGMEKLRAFLCSPRGMLLLSGLFVLSGYFAVRTLSRTNPFFYTGSTPAISQIKLGMDRAHVERLIQAKPSASSLSESRYLLAPGLALQIGFDSAGGPGSPSNRVTRLPGFVSVSALESRPGL